MGEERRKIAPSATCSSRGRAYMVLRDDTSMLWVYRRVDNMSPESQIIKRELSLLEKETEPGNIKLTLSLSF